MSINYANYLREIAISPNEICKHETMVGVLVILN